MGYSWVDKIRNSYSTEVRCEFLPIVREKTVSNTEKFLKQTLGEIFKETKKNFDDLTDEEKRFIKEYFFEYLCIILNVKESYRLEELQS